MAERTPRRKSRVARTRRPKRWADSREIYKQRIASTTTLAKVFRAMEMIAASRIGAARHAATEAGPEGLTQAVAAVAVHG